MRRVPATAGWGTGLVGTGRAPGLPRAMARGVMGAATEADSAGRGMEGERNGLCVLILFQGRNCVCVAVESDVFKCRLGYQRRQDFWLWQG